MGHAAPRSSCSSSTGDSIIPPVTDSHNRSTLLSGCRLDAAKSWSSLRSEYKTSKDFILAALSSPTLPSKSEFERSFPQSLRFDRDVVLAFCARSDFAELYYDRHLYVPNCLTGDKEVMLAYCRKIPRSLQECTEELTDDAAVVRAAIELDGLELQYASMRLQEEKAIVMAACEKDGRALEFCPPGPVRDELTQDRTFMLSVLRRRGGPMLRLAAEPLKRDRELLLEAVTHGMRFRFCPFEFQSNLEFLMAALNRKSNIYLELNKTVQRRQEVALAAICSKDSTPVVHQKALDLVPALCENREVAMALAVRGELEFFKEFLKSEEGAKSRFTGDKGIMLNALKRDPKLFSLCEPRLHQDVDILTAAMDKKTAVDVLKQVSHDQQRANPEISCRAIQVAPLRSLRVVRSHIPDELWSDNRQVAVEWIRRGCRVLGPFEALLEIDSDFCLEIAEHSWPEFSKISDSFKSNREFMERAVDLNGRVLRFASLEFREDFDLCVRAVASYSGVQPPNIGIERSDLEKQIESKLELQHIFLNDFLCGIAISRPQLAPAKRSQLTLLDRGVETSQAFKHLIADFLGVPVGAELKRMRKAHANLKNPVSERSSSSRLEEMVEWERLFAGGDEHIARAGRWAHRRWLRRHGGRGRGGGGGEDDIDLLFDFHRLRAELRQQNQQDQLPAGAILHANLLRDDIVRAAGIGHPNDDDDDGEDDEMIAMMMMGHGPIIF